MLGSVWKPNNHKVWVPKSHPLYWRRDITINLAYRFQASYGISDVLDRRRMTKNEWKRLYGARRKAFSKAFSKDRVLWAGNYTGACLIYHRGKWIVSRMVGYPAGKLP